MPKTKQQQLDEIAQQIVDDKVTPELKEQATQLVFGDGNPDSEIVFIGEAPGKKEDEQGIPFVGAAGRFLNEMLEMIGLQRKDIYITNIVKYRPPNNRDPEPEEKKAFLPYLQSQLEVIQPKVVVTLGRHSMNCFLPDLQISQVHGQPKRVNIKFRTQSQTGGQGVDGVQGSEEKQASRADSTVSESRTKLTQQSATKTGSASGSARRQDSLTLVILPLFHPAAALYNGGLRQTLIDDFALLPTIIQKMTTDNNKQAMNTN